MDRGLEGLLRTGGWAESAPRKISRNISAVAMKIGTRVDVYKRNTTVVFFFQNGRHFLMTSSKKINFVKKPIFLKFCSWEI